MEFQSTQQKKKFVNTIPSILGDNVEARLGGGGLVYIYFGDEKYELYPVDMELIVKTIRNYQNSKLD